MHAYPISVIEPLESRIAPAVFLVGAPDGLPGVDDINYNEAPFVNTETAPATDQIAQAVGPGTAGVADTFYLKLKKGDSLQIYNGGSSFVPLLTVKAGNVVAFFQDGQLQGVDGFNEVQNGEFVGLSMGKNARVEIRGSINGDIVTNLDEQGTSNTADDEILMTGLVSSTQGIAGIRVGANINGNILSGGNVKAINVLGNVEGIYAGAAASGQSFDFFPTAPGGDGTIAFTAGDRVAGANISGVQVDSLLTGIYAGDGGAGARGGSLSSIQVTRDTNGFTLEAGGGGGGNATVGKGGAGGGITRVFVSGVEDLTFNDSIIMQGGAGGNATTSATGGAGGKLTDINVGFELNGTRVTASANLLNDDVELRGGAGGTGRTGGVGGGISNVDINVLVRDANFENNEVALVAGDGGASLAAGGKSGNGGTLSGLRVSNQDSALLSDMLLQAGSAGAFFAGSKSGAGGSIKTATLLASEAVLQAGNGSAGAAAGGAGGSISSILFTTTEEAILNRLTANAGFGGAGDTGNGGKGGAINNLKVSGSDLQSLTINGGTAGNGGESATRAGGVGGAVSRVTVVDIDDDRGYNGPMDVRSGQGGAGKTNGGAGGNLNIISLTSIDLAPTVTAGDGGGTSATGRGGRGGNISNVDVSATGDLTIPGDPNIPNDPATFVPVSGQISAGQGGDGTGASSSGGAGGALTTVNMNVINTVTMTAGNGGDGLVTPGAGGSAIRSAAFAVLGSGTLLAGDAGANGTKAAKGGSIIGTIGQVAGLRAAVDVTAEAGDGVNGGAGGSISNFAFGSTADSLTPTPSGMIRIIAGNGSAGAASAGAGGNLINIDGSPSSGANMLTIVQAGDGGGSAASTRSGAGGRIQALTLTGFPEVLTNPPLPNPPNPTVITIDAGDAGVSANAATGGKGGNVNGVFVSGLDEDAILHHIAAGDGAPGTSRGGAGGRVDVVQVLDADIGVRSGRAYGYSALGDIGMGGIFAGVGGGGGTRDGLPGGVRNISADGIASIVAGKGALPQLAGTVEQIVLNGQDILLISEQDLSTPDGGPNPNVNYRAYNALSYATQNLAGFVQDPSRVDANRFNFVGSDGIRDYDITTDIPLDGLIAATVYKSGFASFTPEFIVTSTYLYDFDNNI